MPDPFLLLCLFGHHRPLRRHVAWDGRAYVGTCRRCGKAIRRKAHRQWRANPDGVRKR